MAASLTSLLKQTSIDDHEEIIKSCNAALKQSKTDLTVQHVKAIALLQLNRFNDAVRFFDECGDKLKHEAELEYAYSLYKAGHLQQAEDLAGKLESRGAKHLQAQASYRLENFANAKTLYEQLAQRPQEEDNDIRINLNATYAQLLWQRRGDLVTKTKAQREDLEAFETAYNAACQSIARGELGQAEVLLRRAENLCNAADELTPEQKQEELLPITIQRLCVLSSLGKDEEVKALSAQIATADVQDATTKRIALINRLATTKTSANPYLLQRQLQAIPISLDSDKFFKFQEMIEEKNDMAVNTSCSKFEGLKKSTLRTIATEKAPTTSARVNIASSVNAAAHAQNQLGKIGLKSILPLLEKRPSDVGLMATIIQLYLLTENKAAAIKIMEKFLRHLDESKVATEQEVRFSPGLVAIILSLYSLEGRKSQIRAELSKAASYWKSKSSAAPGLLKASGLSLLEGGKEEDLKVAGEIFENLRRIDPNDRYAKAGLVAAFATIDPSRISQEIDSLTTVDCLTQGINVKALEEAGIPRSGQSASTILSRKRAGAPLLKPKKKRVRKARLPKDYDPEKKPDPERWLPLRDRLTYRPKGKKGKQKQTAATQGTSEKAKESAGEKSNVVTAPSGGAGGGKSKKKKPKK